MRLFTTTIQAIDPKDGRLKNWCGPHVEAISWRDAEEYCVKNLGYCKIEGELVSEIPTKDNSMVPDWEKQHDYEQQRLN